MALACVEYALEWRLVPELKARQEPAHLHPQGTHAAICRARRHCYLFSGLGWLWFCQEKLCARLAS